MEYVFTALEFVLLAVAVLAPNPLFDGDVPPQMYLRYDTSVYFFALIVGLSFTFRPRLVFWGGVAAAAAWGGGGLWIASQPGTIFGTPPDADWPTVQALMLHERFVDPDVLIQDVVMMLIVASLLAVNAMRCRRLVYRQAVFRTRARQSRSFFPADHRRPSGLAGRSVRRSA